MGEMQKWKTSNGVKIYQILKGKCNCYLIEYEKKYILVDTSTYSYWEKLKEKLREIMGSDYILFALILTHAHFDRVENAYNLKTKFDCSVFIHKADAPYLEVGTNPEMKGTNFCAKIINTIKKIPYIYDSYNYLPCEPNQLIHNELDLYYFGIPGKIIHTPGHTKGSLSLIIDNEIAIVGDTIDGVYRKTIFLFFAQDVEMLIRSWRKLLDCRCVEYLPAHGKSKTYFQVLEQYKRYKRIYKIF